MVCPAKVNILEAEAAGHETELELLVTAACPQLLDRPGIGVITAAQFLIYWSHRDRVHSQAAFAVLADAVTVMDPFHVVRLAGNALDECRRRIQLATVEHRGRMTDSAPPTGRPKRSVSVGCSWSGTGSGRMVPVVLIGV